jgi:Pyridoxamine 5'-phosphate oxidase
MTTWAELETTAPELATAVRERFEAHGLGLLATLRRDGSPRISGVEPLFALGELWLGMMPMSRKALDLLRDPRFALHCATIDKDLAAGDAKLSGRAVVVDDDESIGRYRAAFEAATGYPPPPGPFPLFRADIIDMSMVRTAGDQLDIRWWHEGEGVGSVQRT